MPTTKPTASGSIRILLFEQNPDDANLVAEYLEEALLDYEISNAQSLKEGLGKIRGEDFEVILLNLSLPDSKGVETLKKVQESCKDAIILILTDTRDKALSTVALQAGAQDFLDKGALSGEVLRRSIRHSIERTNLTRKLEKRTEKVERSEALLRNIFDVITDAMLILTPSYEIRFFNPAAAALLESDEKSLVGETFPFEVSTSQVTELEIPEPDGNYMLVELSAVDLLWEGENALLVMLRDITKRKTAELQLKREKERLFVTLDSIADAVIATDESGAIENMNQEASKLTQVASKDATGRPLSEILHLIAPDSEETIKDPAKYLLDPEDFEESPARDLVLERDHDDKRILVNAEMRCILDSEGKHHGCVTVLRDITKQRKTEEELLKEEKLNSISLLASGIAHDFNNMLTAVLGNISIVRMDMGEEDKNSKKLLAAETAALQAKSLTQQLFAFSRGEAPAFEVTTIDQVVEESAQFILRGSNVNCEIEKEEALWPVDADKGQINQVINNLIINADQSMPSGGTISIKLSNRNLKDGEVDGLKAGQYVCIEVIDQGVGISPEDKKRVFDPYFTTKNEGNGLGLASSHTVVKSHHGAMTLDSRIGKGSCFAVYLPKSKNPARAAPRSKEKPLKEVDEGKIHQGSGRILVMDDMEPMMTVAGEILNTLGYEVDFSTNGQEAIEAYKKAKESGAPYDAVVFDLTVPGAMGGEEASNILIEYDPELVAIASSGYTTSNVMSNYKNSAFKAVVPKPYRIKEMSDALRKAFEGEE